MKITATSFALTVAYQLAGVAYGVSGQTTADDGTNNPFEQVTVQPGETFELPAGAKLIFSKEIGLGEAPAESGNVNASGD